MKLTRATCIASAAIYLLAGHLATGALASSQKPAAATKKPAAASSTTRKPAAGKSTVKAPVRKKPTYSASSAQARRAKLRRARAAARARYIREAPIPRYKLDAQGELIPDLRAAAAVIYNPETHEVLWEQNGQAQRSIASITKVMTAIVFIESDPLLAQEVLVGRDDVRRASTTYLRFNERLTADDLLHLLLIASDNAAARVLARISPWGSEGFIARMNEKALELGLSSTHYADPSGLLSDNVSSAYDMARLIAYAAGDERIAGIMRTADYTISTSRRRVTIHNTNQLVRRTDMDVRGGKTGFISSSGYCLATLLRLPDIDQKVAVVVLGARSNNGRFLETRNLLSWLSTKAQDLFDQRDQRDGGEARVPQR